MPARIGVALQRLVAVGARQHRHRPQIAIGQRASKTPAGSEPC
jgi:hypothetical protein